MTQDNEEVLVYDIETEVVGYSPDGNKDIMRVFGYYSYKLKKGGVIPFYKREAIEKLLDNHKFIVGFHNKGYDDLILEREGFNIKYKRSVDLREIIKKRAGIITTGKGSLKDNLMKYSLDYITKYLKLVDEETGKEDIDYDIFKKTAWTKEEVAEIKKYTIRDIEITKKLFEWLVDYFEGFKDFIGNKDIKNKAYITDTPAKFGYKADCHAMGWEEAYNTETTEKVKRPGGGYVAFPAGERFDAKIIDEENNLYEDLIIQLDFSCLPTNTIIKCRTKNGSYLNKKIQNIKVGDLVLGENGKEIIGGVKKEKYNGELIKIELDNGNIVRCTPEHKFPIIRNNERIVVEAKDILETDDMITTLSKFKEKNRNFKGKIKKMCEVCGKEYEVFPSQQSIKTCGDYECINYLKKINSPKTNLGKTKYNCEHLMKMSVERKGKKRSDKIRNNISIATKKRMWDTKVRKSFLKGNENKDKSFLKTIEWRQKIALSRMNNIKNGKYVYNGIKFRSNWEVIFAKGLDKNNIKWEYEPKIFKLNTGDFYLPDFYLPEFDKWVEIKGYMYDHSRKKIQQFLKEHDNLIILNDLKKIESCDVEWLK